MASVLDADVAGSSSSSSVIESIYSLLWVVEIVVATDGLFFDCS